VKSVTEQDWLACTEPLLAFEFLRRRASQRKLRLFACGYWRWLAQTWKDERCKSAVEVAERLADGLADGKEREGARAEVQRFQERLRSRWADNAGHTLAAAAASALEGDAWAGARACVIDEGPVLDYLRPEGRHSALREQRAWLNLAADMWDHFKRSVARLREPAVQMPEDAAQMAIFRDLFGNPFRTMAADPCWRSTNVVGITQGIYDDHAFDRLPVVADALEESGCTNAELLAHCRGPGPHARGCWVVDLLLGKE
jgi:hypothetical protein